MRKRLQHPRLQRKQVCTGSSALNQRGPRAGLGTDLLRLHEVRHVAVVVHASGVEASTGTLAADTGDEAGLGLLVRGVHRADGHHPADDLQQPVTAAHLVLPQGHVQLLVPAKQSPTAVQAASHPRGSTVPRASRGGAPGLPSHTAHSPRTPHSGHTARDVRVLQRHPKRQGHGDTCSRKGLGVLS